MIMDKNLELSVAQSITGTVQTFVSTNSIDQDPATPLAAPVNLDAYVPLFFFARLSTAVTSGGAATLVVKLQTDSDPAFGTATDVYVSQTFALAALTLNKVVAKIRLPTGLKRYIRAAYVVAGATTTAGAIDAALVNDVDNLFS